MNTFKLPRQKTRLIKTVSERHQAAKALLNKFFKGRWRVWADEGQRLKVFWGYTRTKGKSHEKVVYTFSDGGYSHSYVSASEHKLIAQVADPKDLPLMLNDPKYEKSRDFIVSILKGTLSSITKRQDLVNEHDRLEIRLSHINTVKWAYLAILKSYIHHKFYDSIYDRKNYGEPVFLILSIGEHTYHFNCGAEIKLVENIECSTVLPEESIVTPYRLNNIYY